MKQTKKLQLVFALIGTSILISANIDLSHLLNYASQPLPVYIEKDIMTLDNPITDEGATLGRVLFYDKRLSVTNEVSCSSCHKQALAFSDAAELSQGIGGLTKRHSMRLVNLRFGEDTLFRWDRQAKSLLEQMTFPIKEFDEMGFSGTNGAPDFEDLIFKLSNTHFYPTLFNTAFGDAEISEERIAKALAQFVMSIQSFDSKYDIGRAQVDSDSDPFPNFTAAENAGKALFLDSFICITDTVKIQIGQEEGSFEASKRVSGGLNCASCHRPPEFDIDPKSLNNGFTQGNPNAGIEDELGITRSPSLRDLYNPDGNLNGGIFHTGQGNSFTDIAAHYYFQPIKPNNTNLDPRLMPNDKPLWLNLSQQQRIQLDYFLQTLTGVDLYVNEKWSNPFDKYGDIQLIGSQISSSSDINDQGEKPNCYPNPVSDQLTIESEKPIEQLIIQAGNGKVLHESSPDVSMLTLNVNELPKGLFFVRLKSADSEVYDVVKMIKD